MSTRRRTVGLAWGLWVFCLLLIAPATLLDPPQSGSGVANVVIRCLTAMAVASVGALVAARQPRNPIGWIFLAGVLAGQVSTLADAYSAHALVTSHVNWPAAAFLGAFGGWLRSAGWLLQTNFVLLFFPTGRLLSRRWRPALWLAIGAILYAMLPSVFGQDMADQDKRLAAVHNPIGFIGPQLSNGLSGGMLLWFLALLIVCAIAVTVRFRRSQGIERQQLKWFIYATALCVLLYAFIIGSIIVDNAVNVPPSVFYVAIIGLPIGAGVAILRHRLYDIDIIINRTLVYGLLSAVLIGLYVACITAAQALIQTVTGQTKPQPAIIVATTLLVAALFTPVRRWLQALIDRAFYRSRYDATQTITAFGAKLREETNLEDLRKRLIEVVQQTMHPDRVTLWLRPTPSATPSDARLESGRYGESPQ